MYLNMSEDGSLSLRFGLRIRKFSFEEKTIFSNLVYYEKLDWEEAARIAFPSHIKRPAYLIPAYLIPDERIARLIERYRKKDKHMTEDKMTEDKMTEDKILNAKFGLGLRKISCEEKTNFANLASRKNNTWHHAAKESFKDYGCNPFSPNSKSSDISKIIDKYRTESIDDIQGMDVDDLITDLKEELTDKISRVVGEYTSNWTHRELTEVAIPTMTDAVTNIISNFYEHKNQRPGEKGFKKIVDTFSEQLSEHIIDKIPCTQTIDDKFPLSFGQVVDLIDDPEKVIRMSSGQILTREYCVTNINLALDMKFSIEHVIFKREYLSLRRDVANGLKDISTDRKLKITVEYADEG